MQFLTGSGTDAPAGVLTGLDDRPARPDRRAGAIVVGDVYALKAASSARVRFSNGSFALHPNLLDSVFRPTSGSTAELDMHADP